jgi:hypothetical protein
MSKPHPAQPCRNHGRRQPTSRARVPLLACPAVPLAVRITGMKRTQGHRKRIRHYHDLGHIHELTFSGYHRWPLLTNDQWRGLLSESIDRAMERHHYQLSAS